jgi:hypothetical protein
MRRIRASVVVVEGLHTLCVCIFMYPAWNSYALNYIFLNQTDIPQAETVKYLGIHFDRRLTLKDHVPTKRKQLDHKTREIKWLIVRHSPLSLENIIIIYKTVLKSVWLYGIELWGCASNSNIEIIQRYQSKLLKADSHIACRSHAVHLPCRAAKGRFAHSMPCPCSSPTMPCR